MPDSKDPGPSHDHIDGCLCGLTLEADELTDDLELPEAAGGLEEPPQKLMANSSEIDGCDLDFTDDQTGDDELPVAVGGIE